MLHTTESDADVKNHVHVLHKGVIYVSQGIIQSFA
jgi:uncharacterized RmlC-like cupin family protein